MTPLVSLVVVSHSDLLARGVVEVAAQMAPDVFIAAAGGTDSGDIGTSFDRVDAAIAEALAAVGHVPPSDPGAGPAAGGGVVVLTDLGSATMTVESVLDLAEDPDDVVLVDAPLVEGAVAAAVRAQSGDDLAHVVRSAAGAVAHFSAPPGVGEPGGPSEGADVPVVLTRSAREAATTARAEADVTDPAGLHARPAALLARLVGTFDAEVRVDGADAGSVLEVMALGVRQGQRVRLEASGPEAGEAIEAVVDMLEGRAPSIG